MDRWKRELLQLADHAVSATATAGITFGFLADGREIVELVPGEGFTTAVLSDHADEGWPGFELRVPRGFVLQHAFFGVLGRRVALMSARPLSRVRSEFETLSGLTLMLHGDGGHRWHATLEAGVEVEVVGAEKGTGLAIHQRREPDAIADALRSRVMRMKEELDTAWSTRADATDGDHDAPSG